MSVALKITVKLGVIIVVYREPDVSTRVISILMPVYIGSIVKKNIGGKLIIFAYGIGILYKLRKLSRRLNEIGA